jgi:hypothetical protein
MVKNQVMDAETLAKEDVFTETESDIFPANPEDQSESILCF